MLNLKQTKDVSPDLDKHNPIDMLIFCLCRSIDDRAATEKWASTGDPSDSSYWAFQACHVRGRDLLRFKTERGLRRYLETEIAIANVKGD